ncbi:MAG: cysteine--tRNA ligase [Clostridia bacterium]|nr:cysteine--tRNA ligase [Clostridia bacterium]
MLKLYNTYSRTKEEFKPLSDVVRIYSCGPTVYNVAHIGNMRAYIMMDILRKTLKYDGYKLKHVMNITDVGHLTSDADEGEDKMLKSAREKNMSVYDIAKMYTDKFMEDLKRLNIETPEIIAKATDHIKDMEEYVKEIVKNGYGYETSKGVYYDTSKDKTYGELSKINVEGNKAGARIEVDSEKKNPLDFALWIKAPENHIMKWDSMWGKCYPGWHIECSAMGRKYLGEEFDIHTGGVDHVQIHHENEIAQSRGATGKLPAKIWMHSEFLLIDSGKMSKSLGNVYTIDDLINKGINPLAYRYFSFTSHYRNKLNFTWEAIEAANASLIKAKKLYKEHLLVDDKMDESVLNEERKKFEEAINDDLNMPLALSVMWEVLKGKKSKDNIKLLDDMDKILSLELSNEIISNDENISVPEEVTNLLDKRKEARASKDFKLSDEIRDKLLEMGYKVIDSKDGQKIEKV